MDTSCLVPARPSSPCEVLIVSGIPLGDVGGGQRGAQLALALARRFCFVHFVFIFPSTSFEGGGAYVSGIDAKLIVQSQLNASTSEVLIPSLQPNARVIIEVPHPSVLPLVKAAQSHGHQVILEYLDDWFDPALGGDWFDEQVFTVMVTKADRVVATARVLQEQAAELREGPVEYLPNAGEELLFKPSSFRENTPPIPSDWPHGYNHVALYFGSLYGSWLRWDYFEATAELCPKTAIVIIGDATQEHRELSKKFPNIFFVGLKQHDELAAYVSAATVALLPFAPGRQLETISPVKVFEYGFAGTPVVATWSKELEGMPFLHQARSAGEFASKACRSRQRLPDTEGVVDFMMRNSWSYRVDALLQRPPLRNRFVAIVLCHNNADVIGRLVESLVFHTRGVADVQIIVVNTVSTDNSAAVLEELRAEHGITVVTNKSPSCSHGRNAGLAAIKAVSDPSHTLVAFFDSDMVIISASWMYEAEAVLDANPAVGAIGWAAGWFDPQTRQELPPCYNQPNRGANSETSGLGFRHTVAYLGSGGLIGRLEALRAAGGFDPQFYPAGYEDTDMTFSLRAAGYFLAYRELGGVIHEAHRSTSRLQDEGFGDYSQVLQRNGKAFRQKWQNESWLFMGLDGSVA